jgi:ABC-type polysaccharide/polyol phosphate export permease
VIFSLVLQVHSDPVPYPLFIMTNLVLWSYFSRIVLIGGATVTGYMELLRQIRFPREFLPLAVWVESLVDLALGMCIVALGFALYRYPVTAYVAVALLAFAVETLLALAISLLLAALSVFIRDLLQVSGLLLQLIFYLSPIIYPLTTVPDTIRGLFVVNPLGTIFAVYQEALFFGRFTLAKELFLTGLFSALLLALSYMVFKRVEWQFADVL